MTKMDTDSDLDYTSFIDGQQSAESDREDVISTVQHDDEYIDSDYWYGMIYFRCVLAQDVFERATSGCSIVTLEVC